MHTQLLPSETKSIAHMETSIPSITSPPPSPLTDISDTDTDDINSSSERVYFGPLQSPEKKFIARDIARRQALKVGAYGSTVRRSPRLSGLPPLPLPQGTRSTREQDEESDNDSDSINDVTAQLSREETPDTDRLVLDEPSSVLASKIMRAHDNPSPPPQHAAHPGINYVPAKDGQFPLLSVLAPPSPFRDINLLERLNRLAAPPFKPLHGSPTLALSDPPPEISKSGKFSQYDLISFESCPTPIASLPTERTQGAVPAAANTSRSMTSTLSTVDDLLSQSPDRVSEPINHTGNSEQEASSSKLVSEMHEHTTTLVSQPFETEVTASSSTPIVTPSLHLNIPCISDDRPRTPLRRSARRSGIHTPLAYSGNSLSPKRKGKEKASSLTTEENDFSKEDYNGEEMPSYVDSYDLSLVKERRKGKRKAADNTRVNNTSHQKLGSLSPRSADMLTGLFPSPESTPSIEQTLLPAKSVEISLTPSSPPRVPGPFASHPNFSQTTVQRPIIAPTPVRANGGVNISSPLKFTSTVEVASRTPARRVPIQDVLASGGCSVQKAVQLSTVLDQSDTGRFQTIRAPVFTRPTLDDPVRSPAKRVSITNLLASPPKGAQVSSSPMRLGPRARTASVEPRPFGPVAARSRSVEPSPTLPKLGDGEKGKNPIFPKLSAIPRSGAKLPYPLIPGQQAGSDLPHSIPEENENVDMDVGSSGALLGTTLRGFAKSQLRQPSAGSRIPRIGNKPYARPPPKNGKDSASSTIPKASISKAPPFKLAPNGSGSSSDESSAQIAKDQRSRNTSATALKRKRDTEAVMSTPNSHLVMVRQVVPGMLGGKYTPKAQPLPPSQLQAPVEVSPQKAPGPMKFRKVVDGMLSGRYAPAKSSATEPEPLGSPPLPQSSVLPESSSSVTEEPHGGKLTFLLPPTSHKDDTSSHSPPHAEASETNADMLDLSASLDEVDRDEPSSHLRRTPRRRKPAQQQYVLDVFNTNNSRPLPTRRKPQSHTEGDRFMGMSATALRTLTTSNTMKNQQTVAVLATEVIRKDGLRPESPMVKVRTILQKQRDDRDVRRRERAEKRARRSEDGLGASDAESEFGDRSLLDAHMEHDENDGAMPKKHRRGPGDEEDYETPDRPVTGLTFGEAVEEGRVVKQVKWHRGLSTTVYLDDLHPKPKSGLKDLVIGKGCLKPAAKHLPLDPLGNLLDVDNRPSPELVTEHVVVKKYMYDNDMETEPAPLKITRSKSRKGKS
ncbi:hypothetical protein BU15DRAFT_70618 [Melanogaster broomeanus]|nr:hypothetical protein BU15DRAFT_70618 [Melanogaster broomeanus]